MPHYIVKIKDQYLDWSTIVDAPITFGMTLDEFKEYYRQEYGERKLETLPRRLNRVEEKGTSCYTDDTVEDTISCNRAGPDEDELTVEEIYQAYCLRQPIRDGWMVPT